MLHKTSILCLAGNLHAGTGHQGTFEVHWKHLECSFGDLIYSVAIRPVFVLIQHTKTQLVKKKLNFFHKWTEQLTLIKTSKD